MPALSNPVTVSAGGYHTCALDDAGVTCWGRNTEGQTTVPALVNPVAVYAGGNFSCALSFTGVTTCWGNNSYGQLDAPGLVMDPDGDALYTVQETDCGLDRLVNDTALDTDGDSMPNAWECRYGLDANNAADAVTDADADGLDNVQEYSGSTNPPRPDTDGDSLRDGEQAANGRNPRVADYTVSAGASHACAIDGTGVHCWGYNGYGQTNVPVLANPVAVSAGQYHACALDATGVHCWGYNGQGQTDVPALVNPVGVRAVTTPAPWMTLAWCAGAITVTGRRMSRCWSIRWR